MDVAALGVMVPIILIISIVIMIIYIRRFTNQERMAMIEKGVSSDLFAKKNQPDVSLTLRFSLLLIGIGLGFLVGNFLDQTLDMREPVAYFSMLFIFGGMGLGAAYVIEERKFRNKV